MTDATTGRKGEFATRFEHLLDSRTAGFAAWLYRRTGMPLVVVAGTSGMPTHPAWYHNPRAHPRARVEMVDRLLVDHLGRMPNTPA